MSRPLSSCAASLAAGATAGLGWAIETPLVATRAKAIPRAPRPNLVVTASARDDKISLPIGFFWRRALSGIQLALVNARDTNQDHAKIKAPQGWGNGRNSSMHAARLTGLAAMIALATGAVAQAKTAIPDGDWRTIDRDLAQTRFSPLTQITR